MTKVIFALGAGASLALGGLALAPAPAAAQSSPGVVVFGSDPCPRDTSGAIVVCTHRPETERYRLPKTQQLQGPRQSRQSWANQAADLASEGNTGPMSCSAVGPGGHTGCLIQEIKRAKREAQEATAQQTAPDQ